MNTLMPLIFLISGIIGFLVRRYLKEEVKKKISYANVYFFLPIIMFNAFFKRGIEFIDSWISFSFILFYIVWFPIVFFLTRRFPPQKRGAMIITSLFPNAVNLPFPILLYFIGEYSFAAVYAITMTFFHVVTVIGLSQYFFGKKANITVLLRNLSPLYGAFVGIFFFEYHITLSSSMISIVEKLSDLGIILIVFAAGLGIPSLLNRLPDYKKDVFFIGFIRHAVSPLMMYLYLFTLSYNGVFLPEKAIVQLMIESVMPPALLNVSFSLSYGFDYRLTAISIIYLTPLGIILALFFGFIL